MYTKKALATNRYSKLDVKKAQPDFWEFLNSSDQLQQD